MGRLVLLLAFATGSTAFLAPHSFGQLGSIAGSLPAVSHISRRVLHTTLSMNKALARPGAAPVGAAKVAVIGGGISGLVCVRRLKELGLDPTVFDTGKRAVGGRVSSRVLPIDEGSKKSVAVDHSTQFLTATDTRFEKVRLSVGLTRALKRTRGRMLTILVLCACFADS